MFCWRAARVADLLARGSMMNLEVVRSTVPAVMVRLASLALEAKVARPAVLVKVAVGDQFCGPVWVKLPELVMFSEVSRRPPLVKVPALLNEAPPVRKKRSPLPPETRPVVVMLRPVM